jgi:hypothetical protein
VGFGDFSPTTNGGKVFTIFFAVFGVFYVQSSLNELAQYPMMLLSKRNEVNIYAECVLYVLYVSCVLYVCAYVCVVCVL